MGICASCLRGFTDEDTEHTQVDETSPLLHNERNYDKDAQLRKREEELNNIVNETNDKLIDISSFYNPSASLSELALKKSVSTLRPDPNQSQSNDNDQQIIPSGTQKESKAKPTLITNSNLSPEEKKALTDIHADVMKLIEEDCKIQKKGPLVVDF